MQFMNVNINNIRKAHSFQLAIQDVFNGTFGTFIWFHLAWQDIKQRYRRSILGPLWLTISTGALLGAMGPIYARLLKVEIGPYFQHLAVSLIVWMLVSSLINGSCNAFISASNFIKEIKVPFALHLMRIIGTNLIVFGHNLLIILIILIIYPPDQMGALVLAPVGLVLVVGNLFWTGMVLAIFCTRFRDIPQIISSLLSIAFFVTPILWKANMFGSNSLFVNINPFYHLVDVVRAPLLGKYPSQISWAVLTIMLIAQSIGAMLLFKRFRSRISYWV